MSEPNYAKSNGATNLIGLGVDEISFRDKRRLKLDSGLEGVIVESVKSGSLADRSGVQTDDVIIQINRSKVKDVSTFRKSLLQARNARAVFLVVIRDGYLAYIELDL